MKRKKKERNEDFQRDFTHLQGLFDNFVMQKNYFAKFGNANFNFISLSMMFHIQ